MSDDSDPKLFATVSEAAKILTVSDRTLTKMIRAGEVDVRRFGRTLRIPMAWLDDQAMNKRPS